MSNALLLITHDPIGAALLTTARGTLGSLPLPVENISVSAHEPADASLQRARDAATRLYGKDILILTDAYGSTPSNIANKLAEQAVDAEHELKVVAGLNLPMLLCVCNYHDLPLRKLAKKAIDGGKRGVMICP